MITTLDVTLTLKAPFATRSSDSGDVGVDLPLARRDVSTRTADDTLISTRVLMIAGTHVIGKIVHSARELRSLLGDDPAAAWFSELLTVLLADQGPDRSETADRASDGREARRRLTASDFLLQEKEANSSGTRTRIAVDNVTSTVIDGMLQVIEQPFAPDHSLTFAGKLRVIGGISDDAQKALERALRFTTHFGGLGTVGFGTVEKVTVIKDEAVATPLSFDPAQKVHRIRLRFEDPFCTGEARNSPNTYSSANHVPGGVIKGAIARQVLAQVGETGFLDDAADRLSPELQPLARDFDRLRIRHALPVAQRGKRRKAAVIPDSLAAIELAKDKWCIVDLAGLPDPSQPVLIEDKVPICAFDWKTSVKDKAKELLILPRTPLNSLRVRTQIDADRRAAKTSALFGIEYCRVDKHDFLAEVDVSDCSDGAAVLAALGTALGGGLAGIGRGGAFATVTLEQATAAAKKPGAGGRVVVVLQTPALLRDPRSDGHDLLRDYRQALSAVGLPEDCTLTAVFARERLAGGNFFLNRLGQNRNYVPWLLTEPGATFVFDCTEAGEAKLHAWLAKGLSVPLSVREWHGISPDSKTYRYCPYLPENGYGECAINPTANDAILWQTLSPDALGLSVEPAAPLYADA